MPSALNEGRQLDRRVSPAHVQRADALGAVDLVRRNRKQIDPERFDIDRHLSHGLHRIRVEQNAALATQPAGLRHRLEHADFVVGRHHRD